MAPFFDSSSTQRVSVQLVTYNANIQVFVRFVLNLDWESTGLGSWDFEAQSYSVDLYPTRFASTVRLALEFLLMVFLVLNVVSEIFEIWQEAKVFRLKAYFTDVFNVIDWMSFIFQLVSWSIWLLYVTETQQFKMESTYRVLRHPEAQARFFCDITRGRVQIPLPFAAIGRYRALRANLFNDVWNGNRVPHFSAAQIARFPAAHGTSHQDNRCGIYGLDSFYDAFCPRFLGVRCRWSTYVWSSISGHVAL